MADTREMEMIYPETAPCDYFMELARYQMEQLRIQESRSKMSEPIVVELPGNLILQENNWIA